jgi:hypothetical protein
MAEVVAIVASAIAIVQISDRVIDICKFYIGSVSGTPSDLRAIFVEIGTLKTIFINLQFLESCDNITPSLRDQLIGSDGPIEECKRLMGELETLFPLDYIRTSGHTHHGPRRRKLDSAIAALAWPFKASRARELLQKIIQQKIIVNLALTAESMYTPYLFPYISFLSAFARPWPPCVAVKFSNDLLH